MNNANEISYTACTDLIIVGQNSEMADISNPNGNIFGHAAYVIAEDARGARKALFVGKHRWEDEVLPKAEVLAVALNARAAAGKFPIRFADWKDSAPCYGSEEYVSSDQEYEYAAQERADEYDESRAY